MTQIELLIRQETPESALRLAISWLLDRYLGPGVYAGLTEAIPLPDSNKIEISETEEQIVRTLKKLIIMNCDSGYIRSSISPKNTARNILSTARNQALYEKACAEMLDLSQLKEDIFRSLFGGDADII